MKPGRISPANSGHYLNRLSTILVLLVYLQNLYDLSQRSKSRSKMLKNQDLLLKIYMAVEYVLANFAMKNRHSSAKKSVCVCGVSVVENYVRPLYVQSLLHSHPQCRNRMWLSGQKLYVAFFMYIYYPFCSYVFLYYIIVYTCEDIAINLC